MSEKQFQELLNVLEKLAEKFEQAAEVIRTTGQVVHKQNVLLEKIETNTRPNNAKELKK